jgi:hypothetical protein
MKRLNDKLESYYQQDKIKGRLNKVFYHGLECYVNINITLLELIHLIHKDKLVCYLCNQPVHICTKSYSGKQLTLDRIDNSRNHAADNVRICCFTCNMLRSNNYSSKQFKNTFF